MTARVRFVFRGDRTTLLHRVAEGRSPDEFLYGLPYVDDHRLEVSYVEDARPFERPATRLLRPFERSIGRRYGIGFNLHAYVANRSALRSADVIVTTVDSYGLPILWRKSAGGLRAPVVYLSQGLHQIAAMAARGWLDERVRRLIRGWLHEASAIVVLGEGDATFLRASFGDAGPLPVHVIQFGIDERFWSPAAVPADGPMLSVGSDGLRDYPTLLRVATGSPLRIVTRLPLDPRLLRPSTRVDGNVDDLELRELYRRAPFVVIPIRETSRDSGHSATLQAMACGKAVILSATSGLWDRARMLDGETCVLVPPGDANALALAIERLRADPQAAERIGRNARQLVASRYTAAAFGHAMQELVLDALASEPPWRAAPAP